MSTLRAEITYYSIYTLGYVWAFVQICAEQPFDALVLFIITFTFHTYRNGVKELFNERK